MGMKQAPSKRITRPVSAVRVEGDERDFWTFVGLLLLIASPFAVLLFFCLFFGNTYSLVSVVALLLFFVVYAAVSNIRFDRRWKRRAAELERESICTFVRAFDYRNLDTWILRAVYEAVGEQICVRVPIRPEDRFYETLEIVDSMDFEQLVYECADRARRSVDDAEQNPYSGLVDTVEDLVQFLHCQPRVAEAA